MAKTLDCSDILFSVDKNRVDLHQLRELFNATAFWAKQRSMEDLRTAVYYSDPVVTVWDGDRMIGFTRGTSDGVFRATIWDVVIHPDYQGLGLGRKLVETLISHPRMNRVERIYLMTTHQQEFYERIGFTENQTTTMVLHNHEHPVSIISCPIEEASPVSV
ncbi:GCN5-related N-acetyltransferase [[Leptolyngbya] sp. PCC 7376]|uniref:GNAT family N-acetyltransferase n=1 Tax=[Leptolyngbya] sp. PCC 7376 TaxID=111781 RepID=UPI00029F3B7F|nr:GNAT family N-acetyltransferase [[Leptolyngbya] sp. PCC 7376]AFY38873.1 GCN5-related N-acetyltransferase [[Leptolyngbya] sp. PCC 7376]